MNWLRGGATLDGSEFAEHVVKRAEKVRKQMYTAIKYAATFHCEVEDLVDMEEITEEMEHKPKRRFDLEGKEGFKHRMVKAAVGKNIY